MAKIRHGIDSLTHTLDRLMHPIDYADGLIIGQRRHGTRLVLGPDGEYEAIPVGVHRSEILDDASVPDNAPADDQTRAIARAILAACPSSIVAICYDREGRLIGTTTTRYQRLTRGPLVSAIRSASSRTKTIVLAASQSIDSELRDAAPSSADALSLSIRDFVSIDPQKSDQ